MDKTEKNFAKCKFPGCAKHGKSIGMAEIQAAIATLQEDEVLDDLTLNSMVSLYKAAGCVCLEQIESMIRDYKRKRDGDGLF